LIPNDAEGPAGGPSTTGLAAFDFDGTLRRGDSLFPFLVLAAGRVAAVGAIARGAVRVIVRSRRVDRDAVKDLTFRHLLADRQVDPLMSLAAEFGAGLIDGLRPDVVARLRAHQELGHRVVIVSASLTIYLQVVADHLGCELVATNLVERDGRFTGEIAGRNCRGAEKVARLRGVIGERPDTVWAYGDSRGDDEMLAWADHGVRVGRTEISAQL